MRSGASVATREFSLRGSLLLSGGILVGVSIWFLFLSTLMHRGRRPVTPAVFGYISALTGLVLIGFGVSFGCRALTHSHLRPFHNSRKPCEDGHAPAGSGDTRRSKRR